MRSISVLGTLVLGTLTLVNGNDEALEPRSIIVENRQLHTLSHIIPGATSKTSDTSTTITTTSSTSSTPSPTTTSQPGTTLETATSTGPARWALTTTFTQPSDCFGGISQYPEATFGLWQNIIEPVPSITLTSCYPSAFLASATATAAMPPFEQLVCPDRWEKYNYNETYIICCPSAYGLYAPEWASNTQRPGQGGWCTSRVAPGLYTDMTVYDAAGKTTLIGTTVASNDFLLVQATAFDGTADTNVPTSTLPSATSTSTKPTSPTDTSKATTTTASSSTSSATKTTTSFTSTAVITTAWTGLTAISQLPSCGQTCFSNMLTQYQTLGCTTDDPACLCRNANFNYGIRDCSNGACGVSVGSSVIAFETSYYCPSAMAAHTTFPTTAPTPTAISQLPACGQTCFSNMMAQYSTLGCSSPEASCLCKNVNFGYGIRDCSNGACGADVGSTVIAFESTYCASATAAP